MPVASLRPYQWYHIGALKEPEPADPFKKKKYLEIPKEPPVLDPPLTILEVPAISNQAKPPDLTESEVLLLFFSDLL